jgi:C4-dicarboxylate-specific signal transduction histidine kinase
MGSELGGETLRVAQLTRDLRASEQRIALAAEAAKLGFWSRDHAREEIRATGQWRALFDFAESACITVDAVLQRLHPDDRDIARQMFAAKSHDNCRNQWEFRVLLPDGRMRWIATQGSVEENSYGRPVRSQGVSMDITHRKLADAEVHARRSEVAHLLRVASLGELSSALAHELSQPLSAILTNAQAAELSLADGSPDMDEIRHIIRDIVADDRRACEVIVRLRALLKTGEFLPQRLDANELIEDVLKTDAPRDSGS